MVVEKFDVVERALTGFGARFILSSSDAFAFELVAEAFRYRIIPTVPAATSLFRLRLMATVPATAMAQP